MANKNNEAHIPTNPFQLSSVSSTSNLVFASTSQDDAKNEATDQPEVSGGSSTSTSMSSSIFPNTSLQAQGLQGSFSRPFGRFGAEKPETSRVFGNATAAQLSGTPYGVLDQEKTGLPISGGLSIPFSPSNPFSRVSNSDSSSSTGGNIFGGTVSGLSSVPKLFGGKMGSTEGGSQVHKTAEAEQSKTSISQVSMASPIDAGSSGTSHSLATSTPNLFGGVISSSSVTSRTEAQPIAAASTSIFGGKAVESSQIQKVFGGASVSTASVTFGGSSPSKSSLFESKSLSSAESVSSSNVFDDSLKQSKSTLSISSSTPSSVLEFSATDESFATKTEPSSNLQAKETVFDIHGSNKKGIVAADHEMYGYKSATEPITTTAIKPDMIPELFQKDEAHESGEGSPEYHKKDLTKIIIVLIPDSCMDKEILKRHFEKFGTVKRLMINAKVNQATVQYSNHHAASKAKRKGTKIHPKLPEVKIFYGTPARRKSEESSSDAIMSKKKAIKTLQQSHQSSDLDPYTPLERPGDEMPKSTKHLMNRAKPQKMVNVSVDKSGFSKKKQTQSISTAKSVKSRIKTINEFGDHKTYMPHESPSDETSKTKKTNIGKPKSHKTVHLSVDDKSLSRKKQQMRTPSPGRENKESTLSIEGKDKTVLESQAHNNHDKYLILKARDKLLRTERKRTSDLKKAVYLAATCMDMCPELERYMRDDQNDLSSYEIVNGVLDPRLATKKFYRSSADKDVSLPHELRPGPVLLRTMDFLICNIINRVDDEDVELDVWYNYLWNRTRAIRNDLMQQQLTNSVAVVIIERCTRFHILAAVRLCQEPPDLFDAKMNTEHLTKSLQTLKELYHDLGERGEYFDTEAEFRAYEMLLNLNDGEAIVTKYSQYREDVQKSSHVQFVLKVALAVSTNNYVRFFKLIRAATYLQGCLLHRYFRQVRSKALDTLLRVYTPIKVPQAIPFQTVIKVLGFEDESDAVTYLRCHGISSVDQSIILDRSSFIQMPEERPPLTRPMKLVEVNLTCSVGELIQGGPIPDNPLHTHIPHNSFDDQGYLKPAAKDASDQKGGQTMDSPHLIQQPEVQQKYDILAHVKELYREIEVSVIQEGITLVSTECIEAFTQKLALDNAALTVSHEILEEIGQTEGENVCCEAISEVKYEEQEIIRKQKEEKEREHKILEELYHSVAKEVYSDCITEFVDGFIREICQESIEEIEIEAILEALIEELPCMCVNEVIIEEVTRISEETIEEMTLEQEIKIKDFQQKIHLKKVGEYFQEWRMQVLKARRKKQSQEMFPADCSHLSIMQQNEALGWGYQRSLTEDRSALQLSRLESNISRNFEKLTIKNQLLKKCAWYPIFFQHLVMKEVEKSLSTRSLISQYFKVLICVGNSTDSLILHWLRSKLGGKENNDVQEILYNCFSFISKRSGLEYAWLLQEASLDTLSDEDVRGTCAVLFVTSCVDKQNPEHCKMQNLLMGMPNVSYCTIFYDCQPCDSKGWNLMEEDLLRPETSQQLQSLIMDFWRQQGKQMTLVSTPMNNFVCGYIAKKFLEPALQMQNERNEDGKSPVPPPVLIDLYNKVIDFMIEVIEDKDLQRLNWPPLELSHMKQVPPPTWNNTDAKNVVEILNHLKLPDLVLEGIMSWRSITNILHAYTKKVSGSHDDDDGLGLVSHLNSLLSGTLKILGPIYEKENENCSEWQLHVLQLPWTELVYACASYKLAGIANVPVFYQPKKLESFTFPCSWWTACDTSDPLWVEFVKKNDPLGSRKRKSEEEDKLPNSQAKIKKVPSKLLSDIASEKQRYLEFEKKLKSVLEVNEELKTLYGIES